MPDITREYKDIIAKGSCSGCRGNSLLTFLDLGEIPLAGGFPLADTSPENFKYPLSLVVCENCFLVQVKEDIDPAVLFDDYRYLSSVHLGDHFKEFANTVVNWLDVKSDDFIVEIGCNDGVLINYLNLSHFTNLLGVDPAKNVTSRVLQQIPIMNVYFDLDVAKSIITNRGHAQLVIANNVFAHLNDLYTFLDGIVYLLDLDGTFVFEVHYLGDLIEGFQFDTIYHEHRYHYSVTSLVNTLSRFGLSIIRIDRINNHGGSIRVFAKKGNIGSFTFNEILEFEENLGIRDLNTYIAFGIAAKNKIQEIDQFISNIPKDHKIGAYGAAGRAVTLLNCLTTSSSRIEYVVDDSPERIGRYIPGVLIPIVSRDMLASAPVDEVIITAWTFQTSIVQRIVDAVPESIPKIITPLPVPQYVLQR